MLFMVADHKGKIHLYTAEKLHEQIMQESKAGDWNWSAPVTELVRVMSNHLFPDRLANDIRCAILCCFAHFEQGYHSLTPEEQESVAKCLKELGSTSEPYRQAKEAYVAARVSGVIHQYKLLHLHLGRSFQQFCQNFREEKMAEYSDKQGSELVDWLGSIESDFNTRVNAAEKQGLFEVDDDREMAKMAKIVARATMQSDYCFNP